VFRIALALACVVARKGRDVGFGTGGTGRDGGDERGGFGQERTEDELLGRC
jgi:hypothetical protein